MPRKLYIGYHVAKRSNTVFTFPTTYDSLILKEFESSINVPVTVIKAGIVLKKI